ncbi:secy-independent transporter protein [Plasmodium gonderi]|uniref:Secy-independent transporter protein n=1 Tax=Plasmodium gonderi TaxID=77519 RepID=A0A1Y1J9R7_PLAGO|nr:secy-independent transporter protein [Plasmodium gonderi]GAW79236.1 secy-independent transporter protein [Plasmodium gonderi]
MKNLTEAEQKFQNHDWVNDKKWKQYLTNLYPSPSIHHIEKYKRKYFQKNIDKNLDINQSYSNDNVKEEKPQYPNFQGNNNKSYNYNGHVPLVTFFYSIFVLCISLFYFITLSLNLSLYKKMGTFISLSYFFAFLSFLYMDYKTQKQNFSIVQFFSSEKGQYLSYSMILFFIKDAVLIFLPIFFTLLINSYLMYKQIKPICPPTIQRNYYVNKVVSYFDHTIGKVYMMRASIEIYNLVFIIICLFLKRATVLNLIIYLHFFKLKYSSSDSYFHACYAKNGEIIRQCLSHPMVPKSFLNAFNKVSYYFNAYLNYRRQ